MTGFRWVKPEVVIAIHLEQIALYGGLTGPLKTDLLSSALQRPVDKVTYENADVFALAAAYIMGIARNHPFADGNKRTAYVTAKLFLRLNGYQFKPRKDHAVIILESVAGGRFPEPQLADWIKANCEQCPRN
jgi:death-on-curing protein